MNKVQLSKLFYLIAAILFLFAAVGVAIVHANLIALGLFFMAAAVLIV